MSLKITVCGSMCFLTQMEEIKKELEARGFEVTIPSLLKGETIDSMKPWLDNEGKPKDLQSNLDAWTQKKNSILDYFNEVEYADIILIANYDKNGIQGYIGGNVLMEMGIALRNNKPIYLLQQPSHSIPYTEEILGTISKIINLNLELIE